MMVGLPDPWQPAYLDAFASGQTKGLRKFFAQQRDRQAMRVRELQPNATTRLNELTAQACA